MDIRPPTDIRRHNALVLVLTDRCMQNLTFGSEARARSAPLSRENLSRRCNAQ
jgi:hypothetical protein